MGYESFQRKLEELLNRENMEAESNTPDYVLAEYLTTCLRAFDASARERTRWYGRSGLEMMRRTRL